MNGPSIKVNSAAAATLSLTSMLMMLMSVELHPFVWMVCGFFTGANAVLAALAWSLAETEEL